MIGRILLPTRTPFWNTPLSVSRNLYALAILPLLLAPLQYVAARNHNCSLGPEFGVGMTDVGFRAGILGIRSFDFRANRSFFVQT